METAHHIAPALAALGHEARLRIFRVLVKAGHTGLTVGEIADYLGLPASTQAHHLKTLVDAGLVVQTRNGRAVVNTVDFDRMTTVMGFLSKECCVGLTLSETDNAA